MTIVPPPSPRRRRTVAQLALPSASLKRRSATPVWIAIGWRVLAVLGLIAITVAVHWFDRDGLRDTVDGSISFTDVLYFTMISITTTGYGDISPVTTTARMFDALLVTPIRIFVVLIFLGTAYNFVLKRTWDKWRMTRIQGGLSGHTVVAGFGISGAEAVAELIARGRSVEQIVVVDGDAERIAAAEAMGVNVLQADATRDTTWRDVKVDQAQAVVVSAGRDDTSILIVLTVRHFAPEVPISVVVRAADNELLARQAGATTVINPVSFAGLLLAGSCTGPHIADYIADLASVHGRVQLRERLVREDEGGLTIAQLSDGVPVRIYRNGQALGFWEDAAQQLRPGDMLVEIAPGEGVRDDVRQGDRRRR